MRSAGAVSSRVLSICFAAGFAGPLLCQAQTAAELPAFDVVSIRSLGSSLMVSTVPGEMVATKIRNCVYMLDRVRCQLRIEDFIKEAYQLDWNEIAAPDWTKDDVFSLEGIMPQGTSNEIARQMLQRALIERFGLRTHREKRELPVYALLAGKNGVKLQPAGDLKAVTITVPSIGQMKTSGTMGRGRFFTTGMTLDSVAFILSQSADLDLPVVNMTGLSEMYKIDLSWIPDLNLQSSIPGRDPQLAKEVLTPLGLRLEKRKASFNVLVVDHVERNPSEN